MRLYSLASSSTDPSLITMSHSKKADKVRLFWSVLIARRHGTVNLWNGNYYIPPSLRAVFCDEIADNITTVHVELFTDLDSQLPGNRGNHLERAISDGVNVLYYVVCLFLSLHIPE